MKCSTVLTAVALLATAAAAHAADTPEPKTENVVVGGVEVTVDRHGRIAPMARQQRARLLANLRAHYAARGVSQYDGLLRVAADGEESMQLGLSHERITVARITADGQLETTCVRGDEAAAHVLAAAEEQ